LLRTDPLATTVDWRLLSSAPGLPYAESDHWLASVILWRGGELVACDPGGEEPDRAGDGPPARVASQQPHRLHATNATDLLPNT
jgi:hypothetical protein